VEWLQLIKAVMPIIKNPKVEFSNIFFINLAFLKILKLIALISDMRLSGIEVLGIGTTPISFLLYEKLE
jgi:hypothetical protein